MSMAAALVALKHNGFGHFCGRRGSSCRCVAIGEVETIST